ncbi:hypothetical protein GUITHDRAFT_106648 [Guillardia theta CCMP2712]|uniref:PDZ domain-containing protein n=1 Tax=Guillardia theta (strain CCMP2712) TaxID=905079 RepID=L1JHN3_GUITC|nr:hypothetical protein GUITHDRAFT_106648 [Guillardia theta CCMP2712]EKX47659.1 hypothetical protein GUITHDRAFT_106648 [Guillardia theta CCMP2712]|eukprot:XP_005834639.1 hypothetical protein GUITHDRAFT_106648 [Guillardia theta CCMP2712]
MHVGTTGCCSAKVINPMRDDAVRMEEDFQESNLRRRSDGAHRNDPATPRDPGTRHVESSGLAKYSPRVIGTDAEKVGLGIAFQQMVALNQDPRPKLAVKSLAIESPAFHSGQIEEQEGDVLISIDGRSVRGMTGAEIAPYILGPQGSWVELSFERGAINGGALKVVNVSLQRRWNRVSST